MHKWPLSRSLRDENLMYALEMSKDMASVLVFSECSQVQETQMLLHWPGDVSPRRGMEHTEEAPDGAPSPGRQLLSFPLLPCNPGSLIRLRVPNCTQTLCLRSQLLPDTPDFKAQKVWRCRTTEGEMSVLSVRDSMLGSGRTRDPQGQRDVQGWEGPACMQERLWFKCYGRRRWTPRNKGWGSERLS